jgi:hypothetical protein
MSLGHKIEITGGFSIVPRGAGGSGYWNLVTGGAGYNPAWSIGDLTFPNHNTNISLNDVSDILAYGSIYIDQYDYNNVDQSTLLSSLVGNSGTITFTQGANSITFNFQADTFAAFSFGYGNYSYYWDINPGYAPTGNTLTYNTSTGSSTFNDGPVQISIVI